MNLQNYECSGSKERQYIKEEPVQPYKKEEKKEYTN